MFDFKTVLNNIKNLEWKKYFYKNLLVCFFVLFIVFSLITIAVTNSYKAVVSNELNRYCFEVCYNIKNRLNKILDTATQSYNSLVSDSASDYLIFAYSKDISNEMCSNAIKNVNYALKAYSSESSDIDSIYIYSPENEYIISNSEYFPSNFKDKFTDSAWIDVYNKTGKTVQVRNAVRRGASKTYFTLIKAVMTNKKEGLAAYNIDTKSFLEQISDDVHELYIIDRDNTILYSLEAELLGKNIGNLENSGKALKNALENMNISTRGRNNVILTAAEIGLEYKVIVGIDSSNYDRQLRRIRLILGFIIILIAIAAAVQAFWLVMKFYNNLLDLVLVIEGRQMNDKRRRSFKEVVFVKNRILSMIDKNSKIESELANRIDLVNKTKMAALQSQLNPHFLYNTLNLISALDMRENRRDTDTVRAISLLSEILRYAMDRRSYSVPLSEEMKFVDKYIYIQKLKYKERFDVNIDIDESTLNIKVLKMTLQPLIENAIFHGVVPSQKRCMITIKSYIEDDVLKITVADDGVGIKPEVLDQLKNGVSEEAFDKTHTHGLLSVNQRCMLLYGDEFGCEIESEDGLTSITVKYPLFYNEEEV